MLKIAIPDMVSPSYFPVVAAASLGLFAQEGLEADVELVYPLSEAYRQLRAGQIDYVGGAAHGPLYEPGGWENCPLICAISRGMYWFLVLRSDLHARRGDLDAVRGLRIGAAPGPREGLVAMLADGGIDAATDLHLVSVPGSNLPGASFGLAAATALADGRLDGFWANGMAARIAELDGVGTVLLDARRETPHGRRTDYTFAAVGTTAERVRDRPGEVARARSAVISAQEVLRRDPSLAAEAARGRFGDRERELIQELIRTDAPFYDPDITAPMKSALADFGRSLGLPGAEPKRSGHS